MLTHLAADVQEKFHAHPRTKSAADTAMNRSAMRFLIDSVITGCLLLHETVQQYAVQHTTL